MPESPGGMNVNHVVDLRRWKQQQSNPAKVADAAGVMATL